MADREKVIEGLQKCAAIHQGFMCESCEYPGDDCAVDDALALLKAQEPITGETSDGYHTFNELYHHRAVLFSVIVANYPDRAWKAKKHHDGTMYDNMFIVGIDTPDGQATYHYDIDPYWDMFKCRVLDNAPEWDGHTPAQAIERIGKLKAQEPHVMTLGDLRDIGSVWELNTPPYLWMEINPSYRWTRGFWVAWREIYDMIDGLHPTYDADNYGKIWRCWTSRPTDEQRGRRHGNDAQRHLPFLRQTASMGTTNV